MKKISKKLTLRKENIVYLNSLENTNVLGGTHATGCDCPPVMFPHTLECNLSDYCFTYDLNCQTCWAPACF